MSSNGPESFDQAEALRKRMEENHLLVEHKQDTDFDVSQLPPRSEVHRQKEVKKTKIKIRYPIVRFLALIFILIVCFIPIYYLYGQEDVKETQTKPVDNSSIDVVEMNNNESEQPVLKDEQEVALDTEETTVNTEPQLPSEQATPESEQTQTEANPIVGTEPSSPVPAAETPIPVIKSPVVADESYIIHIVKPGETLYRISMRYFKSRSGEAIIMKANQLDANGTVYTGQKLKIPTTAHK